MIDKQAFAYNVWQPTKYFNLLAILFYNIVNKFLNICQLSFHKIKLQIDVQLYSFILFILLFWI